MGGDEAGWRRKGVWWSISCCGDGDVGLVSEGDGAGWRREGGVEVEFAMCRVSKGSFRTWKVR